MSKLTQSSWRLAVLVGVVMLLATPRASADESPLDSRLGGAKRCGSSTTGKLGNAWAAARGGILRAKPKRGKAGWRRDGINPCNTPDPGWGVYDRWSRAPSMGQMIAPGRGGVTRSGGFDLIVHFHGHEPIRKEFVKVAKGIVLVGIDLGIGSGAYSGAFASSQVFENLLRSVEKEMARRSGKKKAHVRKLALSAWSAGYGAIERILQQKAGKKVDALILLDSVHTGYADAKAKTLQTHSLEPFVAFAKRAARGQRFMFHSYSSIEPPGYASTQEVSHYITKRVGGKPRKSRRGDVLGLKLFERYDRGNYRARGYRGDDKPDHCAHIGLIASVVKVHLKRRWNTPRGRRALGKPKERKKAPPGGSIHVVAKGQSLGAIARRYKVSVKSIRAANGLSKGGRAIQPGDELIIMAAGPAGGGKGAGSQRTLKPGEKLHKVASGQSLGAIAKRYRVTVDAIRKANGLRKGGRPIQPGAELVIPKPGSGKAAGGKKGTTGRPRKPGEKIHKVADGQSLGAIAKRYGVTVEAIRKANGLKKGGRRIRPGDELTIPRPKARSSKPKTSGGLSRPLKPGEVIHVVVAGDSLWSIADKYDTTVTAIRKANELKKNGRPLRKGEKLFVPVNLRRKKR